MSRAVLLAVFILGAGSAWSQARIESFSPTGYAKDVRQVAVRFSDAMVALGKPQQSDPFALDCEIPGNGRWIDERHWVYDFDYDVPGAVSCRFNLRDDVRTLAGKPVQAPLDYAFHTGGPAIVDWEPRRWAIDEHQVFLLVLDAVAEGDSIRQHVRCRTAGSATDLPVDLLQDAERTEILNALAASDTHRYQSRVETLVEFASRTLPTGTKHETHTRALERIVMVRCRDPLPAGSDVELVWGSGVAGLNGMATTQERALSFSVRQAFEAHVGCASRFDERCVGGIHVDFTAPVSRELADHLRLIDDNGEVVQAELGDRPQVDRVRFPAAFRDQASYRAEIVAPITDVDGRALANATSFPKTIEVGRLPPGASFGTGLRVVQYRDGPVAPVVLRRIDEPLAGRRHLIADDADIATWMRRVENVRDTGTDLWDAVAAERSVFDAVESGIPITLSPGDQAEAYQTAGVPLPGRGFHIVELELPAVGSLPRRYVAGLVVVTDLAIHVHRAAQSSLVWVTGLSDGLPVEDADIAIRDACTGRVVARATTGAQGIARVPGPLPWRDACAGFRYLVSARKDGDLAVWTSGFQWESDRNPTFVAHEVLDRDAYRTRERATVRIAVAGPDGLPRADAEVALAAVNEGLLDLWPNESWDILDVMMADRYSRVFSSTSMPRPAKRSISRHPAFAPFEEVIVTGNYQRSAGFGLPQPDEDPKIRERFDALLLWRRRLAMDETGMAEVEIPLNDLLTSFRIVAIATAGTDLFGTGEATIRTTQDLILHAGLPEVVRTGDRFDAVFNLRNASSTRQRASVIAEADGIGKLHRKRLTLRPGESRQVSWPVTVPTGVEQLKWVATATGKSAADRLAVAQRVESAVPVRVLQATLTRLAKPREFPVKTPAAAEPDRGGIRVSLQSSLADGLGTVRDAMSRYRYNCLEQDISVAVVLGDDERWAAAMDKARDSLDSDGLLRFFPSDYLPGSPVLTAYVLTIADASGKAVPEDMKDTMLRGLKDYLAGRVVRKPLLRVVDSQFRRLSALAALARHDAVHEAMLADMHINLETLPTSALLDWLDVLTRVHPDSEQVGKAKATLRNRLSLQGTTMGFSTERRDRLWWLMVSTDANAARTILALLDDPDWRPDLPRMMRGLFGRQIRGRWQTTVANAWGTLAANAFGAVFEANPITGTSVAGLGEVQHRAHWQNTGPATMAPPEPIELPWSAAETLSLAHSGTGAPWSLIELRAAVPLTDPVQRGYRVVRRMEGVERKDPRKWSHSDIARIVLDVDASAEMTWVVVEDPLPPGAVVLGSGLGDDSAILGQARALGDRWPIFVERDFDSYRAYYHYVPKGRTTLRYNVRYNTAGTFQLPPSRVEAMYAPEMHGEHPVEPISIR